jgi:multidrug efflux pump subunit AcrA (membrane-fusion protein)
MSDPVHEAESAPAARQTTAQAVQALMRFDGPPEQFLHNLLGLLCRMGDAEAGAVLRRGADDPPEILAVYPPVGGDAAPPWVAWAAERLPQVLQNGRTSVVPLHRPDQLYGQPAEEHLVLVPLPTSGPGAVAAFRLTAADDRDVAARQDRLETTAGFLRLYELRLALHARRADLERLRSAMEILAAINSHRRFMAAAMALCNQACSRWHCDRASVGFLKGRYVHLKAMSHTEKFSRKMKLVQDIEAAMEECLDQDTEVVHPSDPNTPVIARAAAELGKRYGPNTVLSLPLRQDGDVQAVLILERSAEQPFELAEIEVARLTCELCSARLIELHERDRWVGARVAAATRKALGAVLGPKHTWQKLAALLVVGVLIFVFVAKGDYTADAPFVVEAVERRTVPAPFDGYLTEVYVSPGDHVAGAKGVAAAIAAAHVAALPDVSLSLIRLFAEPEHPVAGLRTVLARLETSDLHLRLAAARAERAAYLREAARALRDDQRGEAQIARARADQAAARIDLLEYQIRQATLLAPITGTVVRGELKRNVGAPVRTGDTLFEIATPDDLRAELAVAEDRIAEVQVGQTGELATASHPDRRLRFEVERINPVAEVVKGRNVFKVRAALLERGPGLRPGMEGLAKIYLGRRRYAWLWTRPIVNWLRMKLWL